METRPLTIFGKIILINSLINSSFLFNAQIEIPPPDFIKLADKQNKNFLWAGTPKIAHQSIIADYNEGGISYKDLDYFVRSINVKFLLNLTCETPNRCSILPQFWFNDLFKIPNSYQNENQKYLYNFFQNNLNILDCKINMPRNTNWKGHPFYFEIFKSFHKIIAELPLSVENIISMPIWFNKHLKTKFDADISNAGFNFLKDFFPECHSIDLNRNRSGLTLQKTRKMQRIIAKIPQEWVNSIENSEVICTVVSPHHVVNLNGQDCFVQHLGSHQIYKMLISKLIKPPIGTVRWKAELAISDQQLKTKTKI